MAKNAAFLACFLLTEVHRIALKIQKDPSKLIRAGKLNPS